MTQTTGVKESTDIGRGRQAIYAMWSAFEAAFTFLLAIMVMGHWKGGH